MGVAPSSPVVPPVTLPEGCSARDSPGAGPTGRVDLPAVATNITLQQLSQLSGWYRKYALELDAIRGPARALCAALRSEDKSFCASDDLESEITYMRVREAAPAAVLELAPRAGYSTFFLLAAQLLGGAGGVVHSYDLQNVFHSSNVTTALHQVANNLRPRRLWSRDHSGIKGGVLRGAHRLHIGDAKQTLPAQLEIRRYHRSAPRFGYMFFDAEHSAPFGAWISRELISKQLVLAPQGTPASIHDVFHNYLPSEEGYAALSVMLEREAKGGLHARPRHLLRDTAFTAARCRLGVQAWHALLQARRQGSGTSLHGHGRGPLPAFMHPTAKANPTIFFTI